MSLLSSEKERDKIVNWRPSSPIPRLTLLLGSSGRDWCYPLPNDLYGRRQLRHQHDIRQLGSLSLLSFMKCPPSASGDASKYLIDGALLLHKRWRELLAQSNSGWALEYGVRMEQPVLQMGFCISRRVICLFFFVTKRRLMCTRVRSESSACSLAGCSSSSSAAGLIQSVTGVTEWEGTEVKRTVI